MTARSGTAPPFASSARATVTGNPDPTHISTSYIERQNLTVRMHNRRFTRLTNAFSKNIENHVAMPALHYMHYNFGVFVESCG
jgi:predicted ATPase with chaperone activity